MGGESALVAVVEDEDGVAIVVGDDERALVGEAGDELSGSPSGDSLLPYMGIARFHLSTSESGHIACDRTVWPKSASPEPRTFGQDPGHRAQPH